MSKGWYLEQVEKADSLNELANLIEDAANDIEITHVEYCEVFNVAIKKGQSWSPI